MHFLHNVPEIVRDDVRDDGTDDVQIHDNVRDNVHPYDLVGYYLDQPKLGLHGLQFFAGRVAGVEDPQIVAERFAHGAGELDGLWKAAGYVFGVKRLAGHRPGSGRTSGRDLRACRPCRS